MANATLCMDAKRTPAAVTAARGAWTLGSPFGVDTRCDLEPSLGRPETCEVEASYRTAIEATILFIRPRIDVAAAPGSRLFPSVKSAKLADQESRRKVRFTLWLRRSRGPGRIPNPPIPVKLRGSRGEVLSAPNQRADGPGSQSSRG